jgi:hypothetical protein
MANPSEQAHRPWSKFFGWLLVGALWMTGVASILSVGILILALAAVATWFLSRRPESRRGMTALISIGGLPFFIRARPFGKQDLVAYGKYTLGLSSEPKYLRVDECQRFG